MPAWFTSPRDEVVRVAGGVGLADVSCMAKFDLKGCGPRPDLQGPQVAGARVWLLGPGHVLVTCRPAACEQVLNALQTCPGYVTGVTSVYAQFLLAGPRGRDVLRKLISLDVSEGAMPDLTCRQASLAHVHAILLREDLGGFPAFHILVSRYYAECVWEAILHAGDEYHIGVFGTQAWEGLGI
jgi:heterotetrameric sarcosine oxidase gamma subunit